MEKSQPESDSNLDSKQIESAKSESIDENKITILNQDENKPTILNEQSNNENKIVLKPKKKKQKNKVKNRSCRLIEVKEKKLQNVDVNHKTEPALQPHEEIKEPVQFHLTKEEI